MNIKKNDSVMILVGKDKGKTGKILRSFPKDNMVLVEGINMRKKHERARNGKQKGQTVDRATPIHVSNVKLSS